MNLSKEISQGSCLKKRRFGGSTMMLVKQDSVKSTQSGPARMGAKKISFSDSVSVDGLDLPERLFKGTTSYSSIRASKNFADLQRTKNMPMKNTDWGEQEASLQKTKGKRGGNRDMAKFMGLQRPPKRNVNPAQVTTMPVAFPPPPPSDYRTVSGACNLVEDDDASLDLLGEDDDASLDLLAEDDDASLDLDSDELFGEVSIKDTKEELSELSDWQQLSHGFESSVNINDSGQLSFGRMDNNSGGFKHVSIDFEDVDLDELKRAREESLASRSMSTMTTMKS